MNLYIIKIFLLMFIISTCFLCGCNVRSSTIVLENDSSSTKIKPKTERAIRVENGVIIYKDTKKYDTSKIPTECIKEEDYIFGK